MEHSTRLDQICRPMLEGLGFDLVRVNVSGGDKKIVQVMADRLDGDGITVDDCAQISRALSAAFDVEDPIQGAYTLEVSSPGIDRPLVREADFARFAGNEAKVELDELLDGRKRFRGQLDGINEDGMIAMLIEGERVELPFRLVRQAKLVMTDALLSAGKSRKEKNG
ncbi:MAG: ribosome maturation factor RimP [Magnetovibrionaceae bacterium]